MPRQLLPRPSLVTFLFGPVLSIAACVQGTGELAWPVQSYADVCTYTFVMPFPPICLDEFNTENGFRYPGEFRACRLSVENFVRALDRWRQCRVQEVADIAQAISGEAAEAINCMEASTQARPTASAYCEPVRTSFSDHRVYEAELRNAPLCVREQSFMPQGSEHRWRISLCRDEVDRYLKRLSQAIDEFDRRLRRETEDAADKAVRIFNCMARRESFCI